MKSIIILGDGMSDKPVDKLDGATPLMVAKTPSMDFIAKNGVMGLFETVPAGQPAGSATANLSVLGYDPKTAYEGRAVLEAASLGVELEPDDVAVRCNLISVKNDIVKNHSSGHISSLEGRKIIETLDDKLGNYTGEYPVKFYPGFGYRHLLVLRGKWASKNAVMFPPHDHVGDNINDLQIKAMEPKGETTAKRLYELSLNAKNILKSHQVNVQRRKENKDTADLIWPWSPGKKPSMKTHRQLYDISGAVISAVDLIMGLGYYAGMEIIKVEGATGLWDTNYEGKAKACLTAIKKYDLVYLHVEATDEASHERDLALKIKCIENLDKKIVEPILREATNMKSDIRIALLPDHPTHVETGFHGDAPVPVAIWGTGIKADKTESYNEIQAAEGSLGLMKNDTFIKKTIGYPRI